MQMRKDVGRVLGLLALALNFGSLVAKAQFSIGIEGTAKDRSGAVTAGAVVTLTDTRLGVMKTATTNQDGYFKIDSIAASN